MKSVITLVTICLLVSACQSQITGVAIINGNIYTANTSNNFAQALAIKNDDIINVGNTNDAQSVINGSTVVYDLQGKTILLGIHDVHQHPLEASNIAGGSCVLNSFAGINQLSNSLADCNLSPNSNGWIRAYGHSIFNILDIPQLTKYYLDDIFQDDPACILEKTSHSVWVKSTALEQLGITITTLDPIGKHILKRNGVVDGVLMDVAGDIAFQTAIASTTEIDQLHYEGLRGFGRPLLARNCITTICEGLTYYKQNYTQIWERLYENELLSCGVTLAPWICPEDSDDTLINTITPMSDSGDDYLSTSQIKLYSDGIIINATAALHESYNNNLGLPFNKGLNYIDANRMTNLITELKKIGCNFHTHAIGDRGITESLNAIEAAREINGNLGRRHRITHLEIMSDYDYDYDYDYDRFSELDVIADFQVAANWTQPSSWNENIFFVSPERAQNFMPLKSVYDAGGLVTLSSDWDVNSVNPFVGFLHSVTRAPQNLPSVKESVNANTRNSAYQMQREDQTGFIELGKWADFIYLDQNIFEINEEDIGQTKVLSTWLGGVEVYNDIDFTTGIQSTNFGDTNWFTISTSDIYDFFTVNKSDRNLTAIEIYTMNGDLDTVKNSVNHSKVQFNLTKYPA